MLQDNLILFFSLIAIGLVALLVNWFISSREQRQEYRIKRLKQLRTRSEEVLTTLALLREVNCRNDITETLSSYVVGMIEEIAQLAPGSDMLEEISAQKESADRAAYIPGSFTNDLALKKTQIHINHAEKLLVDMAKAGKINIIKARQFQQDLYWLQVCVFADAHIEQGNYYFERDDKLMAMSHYKHAKAIVARTSVPQKQKQDYIEKIRALLNKARPSSAMAAGNLAASLEQLEDKENKEEQDSAMTPRG